MPFTCTCIQILEQHSAEGYSSEDCYVETLGQAKEALRHAHDENRGQVLHREQLFRLPSHPEVRTHPNLREKMSPTHVDVRVAFGIWASLFLGAEQVP